MVVRFSEHIEAAAEKLHCCFSERRNPPPLPFGDGSILVRFNLLQGHGETQILTGQTADISKGKSPPPIDIQFREDE